MFFGFFEMNIDINEEMKLRRWEQDMTGKCRIIKNGKLVKSSKAGEK